MIPVSRTRLTLALVIAVVAALPLRAQNLITNGDFDASMTGWTPLAGAALSFAVAPSFGFDGGQQIKRSLGIVEARGDAYNRYHSVSQCISPASLPPTIWFSAYAYAHEWDNQPGSGAGINGEAIVQDYAGSNCTGTMLDEWRQGVPAGRFAGVDGTGPKGLVRWRFIGFGYARPAAAKSILVTLAVVKRYPWTRAVAGFDDVWLGGSHRPPGCPRNDAGDSTTACLKFDQFSVTADWRTADGKTGKGIAVPLTEDSTAFQFFGPDNLELIVKVIDACALNNRYWVFAGGLTNVEVTLKVTDRRGVGLTRTYKNPLNTTFTPFQDTNAFDCSPSL